jgi:hypothetical protein
MDVEETQIDVYASHFNRRSKFRRYVFLSRPRGSFLSAGFDSQTTFSVFSTTMAYVQKLQDVSRNDGSANELAQAVLQTFEEIRQNEYLQAQVQRDLIRQLEDYKTSIHQQTREIREESWRVRRDIRAALEEQKRFQHDLVVEVKKARGRYRYMQVRTVKIKRPEQRY